MLKCLPSDNTEIALFYLAPVHTLQQMSIRHPVLKSDRRPVKRNRASEVAIYQIRGQAWAAGFALGIMIIDAFYYP